MVKSEGLNFSEFFKALYRFKYSILSIILISTILAFLYQYYKQNIYRAQAIIEISTTSSNDANSDILKSAMSGLSNIKTEMEVLRSKNVNSEVLKKVDFAHQYYAYLEPRDATNKSFAEKIKSFLGKYKKVDIYDNTPFKIELKKGYELPLIIEPIDSNKFHLKVKALGYSGIHKYNEDIMTNNFSFKLTKLKEPIYKKYLIIVKDPEILVDEITNNLLITRIDMTSNSVNISFEDTIAKRATSYVNELANTYIKQNIEYKSKEAKKKLEFINKQIEQVAKKLKNSTKNLEEFQVKEGAVNLDEDAKNLIKESSNIKTELEQLKLQKDIYAILLDEIKQENGIDDISIFGFEGKDNTFINLITKLQQAIAERKALLEIYTIHHPEVKKQTRIIKSLKQNISKYVQNSLAIINKKIEKLENSLNARSQSLTYLPKKEQQLGVLKRDYMINEKLYNYLLQKKAEISLVKESSFSNTRIIDYATKNLYPVKPKRAMIILVGFIIGAILGILQAYLRQEASGNLVKSVDIKEVQENEKLDAIASIPHLEKCKYGLLGVYEEKNIEFLEAFRKLRTELKYMPNLYGKTKIITITSHKKEEGKTLTALNLAAILGLANKKVILIDANLRDSKLQKYLPITKITGLSSYLNDETSMVNIIQTNILEGVDLINSGMKNSRASELLESDNLDTLIDKLKSIYEYIIIDTPAFNLYSDARQLIHCANLNFYIIRANFSNASSIRQLDAIKNIVETKVIYNDIKEKK